MSTEQVSDAHPWWREPNHPSAATQERSRHAAALAARAAVDPLEPGVALAPFESDLRVAFRWACLQNDPRVAGPLAHALLAIAHRDGRGSVEGALVRQQLRTLDLAPAWALRVSTWRALDLLNSDQPGAASKLARPLVRTARELGDAAAERALLDVLGRAAWAVHDGEMAAAVFRMEVNLARTLPDPRHLGRALISLARVRANNRELLKEAISCCRYGHDLVSLEEARSLLAASERRPPGHPRSVPAPAPGSLLEATLS